QKLSKLLERKGEKEAHVILSQERFLHKAEITINAWDHAMVGAGSDADLVVATHAALDRLEKQVLKVRSRHRDTKRHAGKSASQPQAEPVPVSSKNSKKSAPTVRAAGKSSRKVYRVNHRDGSKPMTVDEAMLEMEDSQDYMVYRDAQTDRVTVLMRRADGHFDLIES